MIGNTRHDFFLGADRSGIQTGGYLMRHALSTFLAALLLAVPASASTYSAAQARALEEAAQHEVRDHDREGEALFLELARKARSGAITIADLPLPWQNDVRNGSREMMESRDRVRLRRIEDLLASLSPATRAANADLIAHAEVDTFRARRELSEPRSWHNCAYQLLDHAEADLAKLAGDRDGDGIADSIDKCPDDPEDKDGWQDEDGCPDPDNDGDGILDGRDKCPNDAEDKDGWQDDDGCPDPDNDGDGILDVNDKCPNAPETRNGVADEDGCPDDFRRVHFASDSSALDADAIDALVYNTQILKAAPTVRLRLEGHCDSQNSDAYNYRLGQKRADAVKRYLVEYLGLEPARLETESHGEGTPLGDNATAEGRRTNRRVEFVPLGGF